MLNQSDNPYAPGSSPDVPTYRDTVVAPSGDESGGKSLPIMALVHFLASLFGHGNKTSAPTGGTPATSPAAPEPYGVPKNPAASSGMDKQTLAAILSAIVSMAGTAKAASSLGSSGGSNPAGDALAGLVPGLGNNISALLASDVQRRQQQEPLYASVLNGAMGMLPVWMRNTAGSNGNIGGSPVDYTAYPPRQPPASGQPTDLNTPASDRFRAVGGDPGGYAFPRV